MSYFDLQIRFSFNGDTYGADMQVTAGKGNPNRPSGLDPMITTLETRAKTKIAKYKHLDRYQKIIPQIITVLGDYHKEGIGELIKVMCHQAKGLTARVRAIYNRFSFTRR